MLVRCKSTLHFQSRSNMTITMLLEEGCTRRSTDVADLANSHLLDIYTNLWQKIYILRHRCSLNLLMRKRSIQSGSVGYLFPAFAKAGIVCDDSVTVNYSLGLPGTSRKGR